MFCLAYAALLRGSEVVHMQWSHITVEKQKKGATRMRVYVDPRSKNDKDRLGHERSLIGTDDGPEKESRETAATRTCAVWRLQQWLRIHHSPDGPMFPTKTGAAMHEDTPRGRLGEWLRKAKIENAEQYGFHSLRAGGASDASRAGASERDIQRHGNWKSNIVRTYIRTNEEERLRVSQAHARVAQTESAEQ